MKTLSYKKHKICKKLGQHFLHDPSIINHIIKNLSLKNNQIMIEIGPGLGSVTKKIAKYVKYLITIELDKKLANILLKYSHTQQKNIYVLHNNILLVNLEKLTKHIGKPLRIFGNIPYNISTPIIFYLIKYINIIQDIHLMLQTELAERLIAKNNQKAYGKLSIMAQYHYKIYHLFNVPNNAFTPMPKVNSSFVKLIPNIEKPYFVKNLNDLNTVVKIAFHQRRKTINNSLQSIFQKEQIEAQGINTNLRAENLSLIQYCRLANAYNQNKNIN